MNQPIPAATVRGLIHVAARPHTWAYTAIIAGEAIARKRHQRKIDRALVKYREAWHELDRLGRAA